MIVIKDKYILPLLTALGLAIGAGGAQALAQDALTQQEAPAFLDTINDVPLMPGLVEMLDDATAFDKPGGRIAETLAAGKAVSPAEIEQFYHSTLPQLGWQPLGDNRYVRQGERLDLKVEKQGQIGVVRFSVQPQ